MFKIMYFLLVMALGSSAFAFTNEDRVVLDNVFSNQNGAFLCLTPEKENDGKADSSCTPEAFEKMKENFPAEALNKAVEMQSKRHGTICEYCRPQANPQIDPKTGYYILDSNTVINACNRVMIQGGIEGLGDMAKLIWKIGAGSVEMVLNGETLGDKISEALLKSLSSRSSGELAQFLVEQCPKIKSDPPLTCLSHSYKYNTTIQNFRKELAGTANPSEKIHPKLREALIIELVKSEAKKLSKMVIDQIEGFGCLPLNQRTLMACDMTGNIVLADFMAGLSVKVAGKLVSQVPKLAKYVHKGSSTTKIASAIPDQAPALQATIGFKQHPTMAKPVSTPAVPKKVGFQQKAAQTTDNVLDQFMKKEQNPIGFQQKAAKAAPEKVPSSTKTPIGFKQSPHPLLDKIKARLSPASKILPDDQIEGILHELRRINCI